jgi:membrane protease YdiL (CAAX protease family)
VKNGYLQYLTPWEKIALFIALCFLSSLLFGVLGASLASPLFGVDVYNYNELSNLADKDSIRTVKMLNFFFHLGTFILPSILFAKLGAFEPSDYLLTKKRPQLTPLLLIILLFFAIIVLNDWFASINANLDLSFISKDLQEDIYYNQAVRDKSIYSYIGTTWRSFGLNIFLLALIPAIGEEFVFRGVLQNLIAKASQKIHLSVWFTAFLFAFIHFQFMDFLPRFFLGAAFGYVVILTGKIWYSMILHFLNNALAIFILFGIRKGFIDESSWWINFGAVHLIIALLIGGFAIYSLSKNSKINEMKGVYFR